MNMNYLKYTLNNKDYYLNQNGIFTENISEILPLQYELLSTNQGRIYFRLKCFNEYYISNNEKNEIILSNVKGDNNLMYAQFSFEEIFFVNDKELIVSDNNKLEVIDYVPRPRLFHMSQDCFSIGLFNDNKLIELFSNGFCILDFNLLDEMKNDFEKAKEIVKNSSHKRISDLLKNDVCFQRLLCHSKIQEFLKQIFKDNFHLTTYSSNRTNKNYEQIGWHVDYPYHNLTSPYPLETLGIQLLILLDDFTDENGGTELIKGSHSLKYFPTLEKINEMNDKHIKLNAKKGSVVIWLGKLWHREGKSQIEEYRSALLANFSPFNIPAKDNIKDYFTFKSEGLELKDDKIIFSN